MVLHVVKCPSSSPLEDIIFLRLLAMGCLGALLVPKTGIRGILLHRVAASLKDDAYMETTSSPICSIIAITVACV